MRVLGGKNLGRFKNVLSSLATLRIVCWQESLQTLVLSGAAI